MTQDRRDERTRTRRRRRWGVTFPVLPLLFLTLMPTLGWGQCRWAEGFDNRMAVEGEVKASVTFRGQLYVGGQFVRIGNAQIRSIAVRKGSSWAPVGEGLDGDVLAFFPWWEGGREVLCVGGTFRTAYNPDGAGGKRPVEANGIARWDGTSWSRIGCGFDNAVTAMAVLNNRLYATGYFGYAYLQVNRQAPLYVRKLAAWDGLSWRAVPRTPVSGPQDVGLPDEGGMVYAMVGLANSLEGGPALYLGGSFEFTDVFAKPALNVARWNGVDWRGMGDGLDNEVRALAVQGYLYAGGTFGFSGTRQMDYLARWDGRAWNRSLAVDGEVNALAVLDSGRGAELHIAGAFSAPTKHIMAWNNTTMRFFDFGLDGFINTMAAANDGRGLALHAAGNLASVGAGRPNYIATYINEAWDPPGKGMDGSVKALVDFDDGSGAALYAAGDFTTAGGTFITRIAKLTATGWSPLGSGLDASANALTVYKDKLVAGGAFTRAGSITANRIAAWNGTTWAGFGGGTRDGAVYALAAYGDVLYAGGSFKTMGGVAASAIAKWDGTTWSPLGSGFTGTVSAIAVLNGTLYAAGTFTASGTLPLNQIAQWDGARWSAVGGGIAKSVFSLAVLKDTLYAGGSFTSANGVPGGAVNRVARWTGSTWAPLGTGTDGDVMTLAVFNDGTGPNLYAGGRFTTAGGSAVNRIARWNGTAWSPVGGGVTGTNKERAPSVNAIASFDGTLYAGGAEFMFAGGVRSDDIGAWASCPSPRWLRCDADGNGSIDLTDAVNICNMVQGYVPPCMAACDCNADGGVDISDAVSLCSYLFMGGAPPPPPFPECDIFIDCRNNCE